MLEEFWNSDAEVWSAALRSCVKRVDEFKKGDYAALDSWFFNDLPQKLAGMPAEGRCIDSKELVKIIEWKLKRGTWRPKLLDFAKAVPEEVIKEASQQAYAIAQGCMDSTKEGYASCCKAALEPLVQIKGIGPASASAILTAAFSCFPYFSDEAMEAALSKKKEYTAKRYVEYAVAIWEKALQLRSKGKTFSLLFINVVLRSSRQEVRSS